MRVRLTRKLAEQIDGVDLSRFDVGQVVDVSEPKGRVLIAEEWAIPERRSDGPARVIAFRRDTDLGHRSDEDDERLSRQRTAELIKTLRTAERDARTLRARIETAEEDARKRDQDRVQPSRIRSAKKAG